jgi:hypothetical protein
MTKWSGPNHRGSSTLGFVAREENHGDNTDSQLRAGEEVVSRPRAASSGCDPASMLLAVYGHVQAEHHFTFDVGGGVTALAGKISDRLDNGWNFGVSDGINIISSLATSLGCRYDGLGLSRCLAATSLKRFLSTWRKLVGLDCTIWACRVWSSAAPSHHWREQGVGASTFVSARIATCVTAK